MIAAAIFTWCMDTRSDVKLKLCILGTQVLWLIYDLFYCNYVASAFDAMTFASNLVGLYMITRNKA